MKANPKNVRDLVDLYDKHRSLRVLNLLTGIPISTLWYQLNNAGALKKQGLVHKIYTNNDLLLGLYIGFWAGDGSRFIDSGTYVTKFYFDKRQEELINYIDHVNCVLFKKKGIVQKDKRNNRASLKLYSKFIYFFPENYLNFSKEKSASVHLKKEFSRDFSDGYLLGLSLSDGYLKNNFKFNTISDKLANNVLIALKQKGYNPKRYTTNRSRYNWKDLHSVYLNVAESRALLEELNSLLKYTGSIYSFDQLKGY